MSDDRDRTPDEIEAAVAKANAEAQRALAEADKATAEAMQAAAEARQADLVSRKTAIMVRQMERAELEDLAADQYHHVYRFMGSVDGSSVAKCAEKLTEWSRIDPGCAIDLVFHSPGGAVIPGLALFDFLRGLSDDGHYITVGATGMAASMAGILIQAGDHRWMSAEAWYMIHRAAFMAVGKTYEIEDEVQWVKRIEKRIINVFTSRSTLTAAKIKRNWDRKDWWLDSDQCLDLGLVDEIRGAR